MSDCLTVPSPDSQRPSVPDHEIVRRIGAGAYGEVWLARNALGQYRGVKFVRRNAFGDDDRPFQREFEGIRRFEPVSRSHPSQLAILHVGRNSDGFYYVMELADPAMAANSEARNPNSPDSAVASDFAIRDPVEYVPHTLRHDLKRHGRLPVREVIELGLGLAQALEHLHGQGLVHRDIKPSNIVFVRGKPKLADIGLVTDTGDERSIVGTEGYLAPEGSGQPQADVYGLGKVLYEAAMGRDRRDFPDLPENWEKLPELPRLLELNEIVLRACAKDPGRRYASARAMAADLEWLGNGHSVVRSHAWARWRKVGMRAALALAALALAVLGVVVAVRQVPQAPALSPSLEAVKLYRMANHEQQRATLERTLLEYDYLHRALKLDPKFVDAYYMLFELNYGAWADRLPPCYESLANFKWCRDCIAAAGKADSPQYHMVNAAIQFNEWHFEQAIAEVERSLSRYPNFRSHGFYGWMLLRARADAKGARREWERVEQRIEPDPVTQAHLATTYYVEGDYAKAIAQAKDAVRFEPNNSTAHDILARIYEADCQHEPALHEFETMEKLEGGNEREIAGRYSRYRAALKIGGARAMWEAMLHDALASPEPYAYGVAKYYARLGHTEAMFRWLEKSRLAHDNDIIMLLVDDWWDPYRGAPEFKNFLRKVGLPENAQGPRPAADLK
jgi:tetratricopeptide (TPR) repeat protein